jgi:DNA adenine methylase
MFDTPMRYPGGKGRLAQYVIDIFELNGLTGGHYVETYAGGAGVAFPLLFLEYASHIHLNDLNRAVYAFWKAVCDETDDLCKLVRDKPLTIAQWKKQRAIQKDTGAGILELGFSTLYMNRTNRSGILHGGVIGGMEQTGEWTMEARFNRKELVKRIEKIASYAPRISLYNLDAADFLQNNLAKVPKKSLVYLDPPYFANGHRLYKNVYKAPDHAKIADLVGNIKQRWIVSYDNAPGLRKLYRGYDQETFNLQYTANNRYMGKEVMIFCPGLETPASVQPFRGIAA